MKIFFDYFIVSAGSLLVGFLLGIGVMAAASMSNNIDGDDTEISFSDDLQKKLAGDNESKTTHNNI